MGRYIPEQLRTLVAYRADFCCEYCKLPQLYAGFTFEIDHILPLKHGGETTEENLALACPICNGNKGSDLGTILAELPEVVTRFFNPRTQHWNDHFIMDQGEIIGITPEGKATVRIFSMNNEQDKMYRKILVSLGLLSIS